MRAEKTANCPRCEREIVVHIVDGQLAICATCGEPLPEVRVPQLSAKAQFGVLLGASSFFLSVLAGIPAILLGWMALRDIRQRPDDFYGESAAKRAIVLAVVGSLFTGVVFAMTMDSNRWNNVYHGTVDVNLITADAEWRWLHPAATGTEPSENDEDFYQTFFLAEFDDSSWQADRDLSDNQLGFGYGDPVEINIGEPPENQRGNAYFRHRFFVDQAIQNPLLRMVRDDGIIIYLDGVEVLRDNIGEGEQSATLTASRPTPDEFAEHVYALGTSLAAGEHTLVISLHNRDNTSSDLRLAKVILSGKQ